MSPDTLKTLADEFRPTFLPVPGKPQTFTWEVIADANFGTEMYPIPDPKQRRERRINEVLKADGTGIVVSDGRNLAFRPGRQVIIPFVGIVRRFPYRLEPGEAIAMFLPDSAQIAEGYLEMTATLSIGGAIHAEAKMNDTFDMILQPLSATHAVLRFVDEKRAPKAGVRALVRNPAGEEFEVEADDHGEVYLPAPNRERFRVLRLLPDTEQERLALSATRLFPSPQIA